MIAWVVGHTGMLGSALAADLAARGTPCFLPTDRIPWGDVDAACATMKDATAAFVARVGDDAWSVYWAAGIGTLRSDAASFDAERRVLDTLLEGLRILGPASARGRLVYASSAGAIYAGSDDALIDESSCARPTTAYAHAKCAMEATVISHAAACGTAALVARISTLYGAHQAMGKQQGLLSHIARCVTTQRPIEIFVPFDTIRDYLAVEDAAAILVETGHRVASGEIVTKIVASEVPVTIGEILGLFRRLARRPPRIVASAQPRSAASAQRMCFRSRVLTDRARRSTTLLCGIGDLLAAERRRLAMPARVERATRGP